MNNQNSSKETSSSDTLKYYTWHIDYDDEVVLQAAKLAAFDTIIKQLPKHLGSF